MIETLPQPQLTAFNFKKLATNNQTGTLRVYMVPKSGTNLLKQILFLLNVANQEDFKQINIQNVDAEKFDPKKQYIISIRDPRDTVISLANWMINPSRIDAAQTGKDKRKVTKSINQNKGKTLNERVTKCLTDPTFMGSSIASFQSALKIKQMCARNVFFFKFEDFIGPQFGGAPKKIQLHTIIQIAKACKMNIGQGRARSIANKMVGGTLTYTPTKNKVGAWTDQLSDANIKLIKEKLNPCILGFGYETDPDWEKAYLANQ